MYVSYFRINWVICLHSLCHKLLAPYGHVPGSLVVRIPRSHRGGRGSIPRLGSFLDYVDTIYRVIITWKTPKRVHSTCIS